MLGVGHQTLRVERDHAAPAIGPLGIKVVSMALLLPRDDTPVIWEAPTQDDAYVWRGTMEASAAREFLADVEWGELDYLFIDLPPGAERLPHLAGLLAGRVRGAVVTIPSQVSRMIVAKAVVLARTAGIDMIGVVENMAGYVCPRCGAVGDLFPGDDAEAAATSLGLPSLGTIPFDPRIALCADRGDPFIAVYPDTAAAEAFAAVASRLDALLEACG